MGRRFGPSSVMKGQNGLVSNILSATRSAVGVPSHAFKHALGLTLSLAVSAAALLPVALNDSRAQAPDVSRLTSAAVERTLRASSTRATTIARTTREIHRPAPDPFENAIPVFSA